MALQGGERHGSRGRDAGSGGLLALFRRDFNRELIAWGALLELALLLFWRLSGVYRGSPLLVPAFFIPGLVWAAACWRVLQRRRSPCTPACPDLPTCTRGQKRLAKSAQGNDRSPGYGRTRLILLGFAALFHLTFLLTPRPLSNDLYRYAWDGKLLALGINPYAHPPAAAELEGLRDAGWVQIFNRDVPTGYPPLAEALFALAHRLGSAVPFGQDTVDAPPLWILRGFAAIASLGTAALLMRALHLRNGDERRVIIYAWSPLVAMEFANSGHLDVYAILCLSAALVCTLSKSRRSRLGTAVFLALGGLAKFYPALLAPLWGRRWGRAEWAAFVLVTGVGWLPFLLPDFILAGGGHPFSGLGIFALRGDFNGGLYRLVEGFWFWLLESAYARVWAKGCMAALIGWVYLGLLRGRPPGEAVDWRGAGRLIALALLFSPVVHPWYFCWMLAFTAVDGSPAWLVIAVTSIFARTVYIEVEASGVWQEPVWTAWAVWLPLFLALGLERLRPWLRRRHRQDRLSNLQNVPDRVM